MPESCPSKANPLVKDCVPKVSEFTECCGAEKNLTVEDRAAEVRTMTEVCCVENNVVFEPTPRKICVVSKLKAAEMYLIPRRFGKVDARERHVHVLVGRI